MVLTYKICLCTFVFTSILPSFTTAGPMRQTGYGKVEGKLLSVPVSAVTTRFVEAFLGIPFAQPPIESLRFAAPRPPRLWKPAIKQTKTFGPSCFHSDDTVFPGFVGAEMWNAPNAKSENCLHLNVWKSVHSLERSPVMVWIYGGSFFSGTSALKVYDGSYLAAKENVVVVSLNYRLGPLGFMPPLGNETPGNAGLLDQQMALEWVRDNIARFDGDPNAVTLFGESAGAASIALHGLNPTSQPLFRRVILQSGSQMTPWASIPRDVAIERARQLGSNLNCQDATNTSEDELLACFRQKTATEIFDASWSIANEIFDFPFIPVHGTEFLPKHPREMTVNGQFAEVDVLAGFNSNEGSYFNLYTIPGFNIITESILTRDQYYNGINLCGLRTNEIGRQAAGFLYRNWSHPQNPVQYRDALDSIVGHFHIQCPIITTVMIHSKIFPTKNVYLYHLSYRHSKNPWPRWMGVMHGYEIELVFGLPMFVAGYNDLDRNVSERMAKAWSNFAKYGNPNGERDEGRWSSYTPSNRSYVEISADGDITRSPTPQALECAFWEHYLPRLEDATAKIDDLQAKWTTGFHRWSDSMDKWETNEARCSKDSSRQGNT